MTIAAADPARAPAPHPGGSPDAAGGVELRVVTAADAHWHLDGLSDLLQDAVGSGASMGHLAPLARAEAERDWQALQAVLSDDDLLWIACAGPRIVGCVRLRLETSAGGRHRGTIERIAVHTGHRRRGIGGALLATAEDEAIDRGRGLLLLDVESGSAAERFFERRGWQAAGTVPGFAAAPDGALRAATRRFKHLRLPGR
jgi:ribosomal protein S18 acetylase RimI-like enzyme